MQGTIGAGFGGKRYVSRALLTSSAELASGRLGHLGVPLPTANLLAVHMDRGVASAQKDFQG